MIDGTPKKIIPYFNFDEQEYDHYKDCTISDFSADPEEYVLHKEERLSFDLYSYMDLLSAPYYVLSKDRNSEFTYPYIIVTLFKTVLFPDPKRFELLLKENIVQCRQQLAAIEKNVEGDRQLSNLLTSINDKITAIRRMLNAHICITYPNEYIEVSKKYFSQLVGVISTFTASLKGVSLKALLRDYHLNNPSLSWLEKPLAFFQHSLCDGGLEQTEGDYWYEVVSGTCITDLPTYIEMRFISEARTTWKLLRKRFDYLKAERREIRTRIAIMKRVCVDLDFLYQQALIHRSTDKLVRCHQVFQWLSLMLKEKYPEYEPETNINDLVFRESLIKASPFMKNLGQLKVSGAYQGSSAILFCREKYHSNLTSLLAGNTDKAREIILNGSPYDVYYFFYKLLEKKPFLKVSDLRGRIFVHDLMQPFNIKSYISFVCAYKDRAPSIMAIDKFFVDNYLNFNQKLYHIEY